MPAFQCPARAKIHPTTPFTQAVASLGEKVKTGSDNDVSWVSPRRAIASPDKSSSVANAYSLSPKLWCTSPASGHIRRLPSQDTFEGYRVRTHSKATKSGCERGAKTGCHPRSLSAHTVHRLLADTRLNLCHHRRGHERAGSQATWTPTQRC